MSDIVNGFFHMFYPPDADTNWRPTSGSGGGIMREYLGDRVKWRTIFPEMVCADGFKMSVQAHSGAYSNPRDDFANRYEQVEVLGPDLHKEFGRKGEACGDGEWLYGYVPIAAVEAVIVAHGGLVGRHETPV